MKYKSQQRAFKGPWLARKPFAKSQVIYSIPVIVLFCVYLAATTFQLYGALYLSNQQSTTLEYYDVDFSAVQKIIADCTIPPKDSRFTISPVTAQHTVTGLSAHKMVLAIKAIHNEDDIIQENLLWYLDQGFRRFLLLDTGSTDGTIDTLSNFRQDYQHIVEVVLIIFRKFSDKVDKLESMIFQFATQLWPDTPWIFVVDTDEFVVSNNGLLQDMNSIPKDKDALLCQVDQYCPLQNYTIQDDTVFYRKNQHLLNVSNKQKCIGRPNFFYRITGGHHIFRMLQNLQCVQEFQNQNFQLNNQTLNITSNCQSFWDELQIGHNHECKIRDITLINLPRNSKIFQYSANLRSAFEDLVAIFPNKDLKSYVNAADGVYSMFKTHAQTGKSTLNYNVQWDYYRVFYPPIKRSINITVSNMSLSELQSEFHSYMKGYKMSSNDMVLFILHTDPAISLATSIKWHFSLGFRRFFVLSTFQYDDNQRIVVDQVSKELGKFTQIATIELNGYYSYSREGLLEVINSFITYSQAWSVSSMLSFFILDHQILISESVSVFDSVVDANERQNCKIYSTNVTDCSQKSLYQTLFNANSDCVSLSGIHSHQALGYNWDNHLQLQFSAALYKSKPQANYFSIQSNMTKFIDTINSYRYLRKLNYAACRDYNISFREYPIRSKSHFIRKFKQGGPHKYSIFRKQISKHKDKDLVYEYIYKATRTAASNGVYDPLPIDKAINNAQKLKKNSYLWGLK